jgi:ABC-2 type transport system permease protein
VLIFLFAAGATPHASWVEMPLLLIMLALLSTGLGMILSVSYVRYRDVQPIWDVILQITFYASGVFFSIATLKPATLLGHHINLSHVLMANPFAALLQQSRHVFIDHRYPTAAHAIGGSTLLLIPIGIGVLALVGGFLLFDREAPWVAEQL